LKSLKLIVASSIYAALLVALWFGFHRSALALLLGADFPRAFASFALLLAPLWFLGFGAAEPLKNWKPTAKIAAAGLLSLSYFVFAAGTPLFSWRPALIVIAFPVLLAAFLEFPNLPKKLTWRDAVALIIIAATYYLKWLQSAWPPELGVVPKLFLADVALYCFLVIRDLEGSGYSLVPSGSAFITGIREWVFFFPIALVLGELTRFIHFHAGIPSLGHVVAAVLLTFLLIAIPEELFFRAIIQNLFETRLGKTAAVFVGALLFGLSHFNHGSAFNWRYVLLATIAGIFYGRAWRANRQIFASIVTHTAVDVVWSLWFR
jgi:uncharacterized protein